MIWIVNGNEYPTSVEAALAMEVSTATIIAWCKGRKTPKKIYPPREECAFKYLYTDI